MSEGDLVKAGIDAVLRPFSDLIMKIAGPAAEEIGLTLQDHVKVIRLRRQLRFFEQVKMMLEGAGISPKRVPLKLLGPIVEAASIEEDDLLQDKWAALLANAAAADDRVHPSFIEVLKQLSAVEAHFLGALFSLRHKKGVRGEGKVDDSEVITLMFPELRNELSTKAMRAEVEKTRERFERSGLNLNLDRLGLAKVERMGIRWYEMTPFGKMFVEGCQAPRKEAKAASDGSVRHTGKG